MRYSILSLTLSCAGMIRLELMTTRPPVKKKNIKEIKSQMIALFCLTWLMSRFTRLIYYNFISLGI